MPITDILGKRQLHIEITKYDANGEVELNKKFENTLNAKFNFVKNIGNTAYGDGKVSICGLDKATIETLTGFADRDSELKSRKIIRLKAGYDAKQLGLMVNGSIVSALPTLPPDIWLDCIVINNYEERNRVINFTTTQTLTLEDYIKAVADKIGITTEIRIKDTNILKKQISKQSITGSIFEIVFSIVQVCTGSVIGVAAYIENETLVVDYSELPISDERIQSPIVINKATGLIGLPEIFNAGKFANITTLLDTSIKTGNVLKLESEAIPSANGLYYVMGITYSGEFRGNAWYSMFYCRRIYNA